MFSGELYNALSGFEVNFTRVKLMKAKSLNSPILRYKPTLAINKHKVGAFLQTL